MTIVGGIGMLIVLFLVLTNAQAFGTITKSIADSGTELIGKLQGK